MDQDESDDYDVLRMTSGTVSEECGQGLCLAGRREDEKEVRPDSGNRIHLYIALRGHLLRE